MKQILIALALSLLCTIQISAQNKETVVDNNDLFAPFRTVYRQVEDMDFSTSRSLHQGGITIKQHVYQRSDWMNDNYYKDLTGKNTSGSSRKGISSSLNDYSTVRVGSGIKGKSVSDRNMEARRRYVDRHGSSFAKMSSYSPIIYPSALKLYKISINLHRQVMPGKHIIRKAFTSHFSWLSGIWTSRYVRLSRFLFYYPC